MENNSSMRLEVITIMTLLLLALFTYPFSARASIDYEFSIKENTLHLDTVFSPTGQKYMKISGDRFWANGNPGEPEIPYTNIRFLVPDNATDFSAEITAAMDVSSLRPDIKLFPVQEIVPINQYSSDFFTEPNEYEYETYSSSFNVQVMEDSWLEGKYHVVTLAIRPVSYTSESNTLSICKKMHLRLNFKETKNPTFKRSFNNGFGNININDIVVNSETGDSSKSSSQQTEQSLQKTGRYYIISQRSLLPALDDLATWKVQKGYEVTLKAIEDIYENPLYEIGSDNGILDEAASLRKYLQDEHAENGCFYCLLVGDHKTSMPIRKVRNYYTNNPNGDSYLPTDNYFSDLSEDDWNLIEDANGLYVCDTYKTNFSPDIYVGRLLCHTKEQISNYITKLILYESNPGRGNAKYLDHATITVQLDGASIGSGHQPHYKKIIDRMKDNFITVDSLIDCRVFDPNSIGSPTGNQMLSKLNNSGYCSLVGHGEPSSIACSGEQGKSWEWEYVKALNYYSYNEDPNLRQTNIKHYCNDNGLDLLTNKYSPSIIYTLSCTTCPFDIYKSGDVTFDLPHTMASSYTVGGLYGGVAYLGNTRQGYFPRSPILESLFLDNLKNHRKIGVAEALSKYLYTNDSHVQHTHNLIGDPEFEIWLHEPVCLEVGLHWKNEYILFDNPNKYDGMIVINDGEGNIGIQTYDVSNSTIRIPYLNESDKMESVAIFKTGHLPVVKLDCSGQRLINCNKKFVVKDASLGLDKENATDVVISDGANVAIRSIDKTECGKLLKVTHNGNLEIKSDRIVNIDGSTVEETGKMEVSGEKVCISNGFSVKRGGSFSVNKNKELTFTRL